MKKVIVIHGPNLNLLGDREPQIYGQKTLEQINTELKEAGTQHELEVETYQSNHEGEIIDAIQKAGKQNDCLIINPGAFTHYSFAIRDALAAIDIPVIETHMSNVFAREKFRRKSVLSPVVTGLVSGFGAESYNLALEAAARLLTSKKG